RCQPKARAGTPLALSHGFYNTLSGFIQGRFHEKLGPSAALLEQMFSRFMEGRDPTQFTLREKATFVAQGVLSGKIFELAKPANVSLWNELSRYFARPEVKERSRAKSKWSPNRNVALSFSPILYWSNWRFVFFKGSC